MKTTNNTILITGGSAGIGFEIAKLFSENGNKVIITGRDAAKLQDATDRLNKNVTALVSDVTKTEDVEKLANTLTVNFPSLNVVINNAGYAVLQKAFDGTNIWKSAEDEMYTNYISVIRLTEKLLPLLKQQRESAIVNVTSIVAYAPGLSLPTYSASKAALNSYSMTLRLALKNTSVSVYELMPPLVNTSFSAEIGGEKGIPPAQVAQDLWTSLEKNEYQIHVGQTADIYSLLKISPLAAFNAMNGIA